MKTLAATFSLALIALALPASAQDLPMTGNDAGVEAATRGDFESAVTVWRPLADAGDPDAQFNLAQAYKLGRGVPTDLAEAERYYGMAANQGHWRAADNYGVLLFHRGARAQAMPYLAQAAERGDARAQYLYGLALFNGEIVGKDWVRGYAMMTLATNAGLEQATRARAQMDDYIPIEQRRRGVALSTQIAADARDRREQLEADALAGTRTAPPQVAVTTPVPVPAPVRPAPRTDPRPSTPAQAGADYTRPSQAEQAQVTPPPPPPAATTPPPPAPREVPAMNGPWQVQLGAFSIASGADRLWARLSDNPALAGAQKVLERSGNITRLKAGGYATRAAAQQACSALKRGGQDCLVTR